MRCLVKNKTPFFYATVLSETDVLDEDGLYTGETEITYSDPVQAKGNISPASGSALAEVFGIETKYSKVIVMDDINFPITETSIVWIDRPASEPYNYVVRQRAVSKNYAVYALQEVTVG